MMKILTITALLFTATTYAEMWVLVDGDAECPDVLVVKEASYIILNDCYGIDPKNPIIESGRFKSENGYFSFIQSKIDQPSFLKGDSISKKFKVLKSPGDELHLKDKSKVFKFRLHNGPK